MTCMHMYVHMLLAIWFKFPISHEIIILCVLQHAASNNIFALMNPCRTRTLFTEINWWDLIRENMKQFFNSQATGK